MIDDKYGRFFVKPEEGIQFMYLKPGCGDFATSICYDFDVYGFVPTDYAAMLHENPSALTNAKREYYDLMAKAEMLSSFILEDMLDKAIKKNEMMLNLHVGDIIELNHKYGKLTKGRVEAIGCLYKTLILKPIGDWCLRVRLIKKDGSDSEYTGYVTSYGVKPSRNYKRVVTNRDNSAVPQQGCLFDELPNKPDVS